MASLEDEQAVRPKLFDFAPEAGRDIHAEPAPEIRKIESAHEPHAGHDRLPRRPLPVEPHDLRARVRALAERLAPVRKRRGVRPALALQPRRGRRAQPEKRRGAPVFQVVPAQCPGRAKFEIS